MNKEVQNFQVTPLKTLRTFHYITIDDINEKIHIKVTAPETRTRHNLAFSQLKKANMVFKRE